MNHQANVETIFKLAATTLPTELETLLGQELRCGEPSCQIVTKEEIFSTAPRPKSSLAHLKVTGDHEGEAFLILPVKAAIIFGGTLIMLPLDQIKENSCNGELDGEVADAYGEVANIVAGVLTQTFVDNYSKNIRFIRTEVEELGENRVDISATKPIPAGKYVHLETTFKMGGMDLGKLEIITPVTLLDLDVTETEVGEEKPVLRASAEASTTSVGDREEKSTISTAKNNLPKAETREKTDFVLKQAIDTISKELEALLGQSFTYNDLKLEMVEKVDFFTSLCREKSILTHMEVSGKASGRVALINQLSDAILVGGTLIMLPEETIQKNISQGEFDEETADAYSEVVNIIAGALSQCFREHTLQLRFVKTTSETVIPTKVVASDESPFPEGLYYRASCSITLQKKPLGHLHILFPAALLGLEVERDEIEQTSTHLATNGTNRLAESSASHGPAATASAMRSTPQPQPDAKPVVLVISDDPKEAEAIGRNLSNDNYEIKKIGFKEDIRSVFGAHPVLEIFLLMAEVGEKGFSVAIKLQSSGYQLPPLIVGGPKWTRATVLKAVKYGARDILVTPATDDEICEKVKQYMEIPV